MFDKTKKNKDSSFKNSLRTGRENTQNSGFKKNFNKNHNKNYRDRFKGDRPNYRDKDKGDRPNYRDKDRNDRSRNRMGRRENPLNAHSKFKEDIIQIYTKHNSTKLPIKATHGSAGYDVYADMKEDIIVEPGRTYLIPTGIHVGMPENYECQVRGRSGLALKHGIVAVFGTVDSDYSDEVQVMLYNISKVNFTVERGMRVGQLIFNRLSRYQIERSEFPLKQTKHSGFGSTGLK